MFVYMTAIHGILVTLRRFSPSGSFCFPLSLKPCMSHDQIPLDRIFLLYVNQSGSLEWFDLLLSDCPLDTRGSNFTLVASFCSNPEGRKKCCRYLNAYVAVSVARYANSSSNLGVASDLSDVCLTSISQTLELYGVPSNVSGFCGLGTKIPVTYECKGRTTVTQMLQSPGFPDVTQNCQVSALKRSDCKKCINASILYLRRIVGPDNNLILSTCRDAAFTTLASQADNASIIAFASCFFGVPLLSDSVSVSPSPSSAPKASPSSTVTASPSELSVGEPLSGNDHHFHLTVWPSVAIAVTMLSLMLVLVLVFLIRKKSRELEDPESSFKSSRGAVPLPPSLRKIQEGPSSMFRKFSYKEIKKATINFNTVIGQGGFGTVYRAEFSDGVVAAVKRMNKESEQAEDEFCKEIELLARLHHRHLVSLKGFCIKKHERFLVYEYLKNGSLKDQLHTPGRAPISWSSRIQIAIDVANALEYLHYYCDPSLCHRDIKSSNILLDENFVAKVADFGLAHAAKDGSVSFEPINTDVRGTPGYMDPEYVVTRELSEKSDIYSYGVVLLELLTGRRAIQDNRNIVEWSKLHSSSSEPILSSLVDPAIGDSFDYDQIQTMVTVIKWCTQNEGRARPSIKQVLRLLYDSSDPLHGGGFVQAVEDEFGGNLGLSGSRRLSKGKTQKGDVIFHSGDGRYLASSSSTSRSYCSRSFLLDNGSPQSPPNIPSI